MLAATSQTTTAASDRGKTSRFYPPILAVWIARRRVRRELASLHDNQLRDAGLDRRTVRAEAAKPFWAS